MFSRCPTENPRTEKKYEDFLLFQILRIRQKRKAEKQININIYVTFFSVRMLQSTLGKSKRILEPFLSFPTFLVGVMGCSSLYIPHTFAACIHFLNSPVGLPVKWNIVFWGSTLLSKISFVFSNFLQGHHCSFPLLCLCY